MNGNDQLQAGILKCRDLVQLYYGVRMVTTVVDRLVLQPQQPFELMGIDPRRIAYEINIVGDGSGVLNELILGSQSFIDAAVTANYQLGGTAQTIIRRNFLTDLDGVTAAVWASVTQGTPSIFTRETFLTPLPVDESP